MICGYKYIKDDGTRVQLACNRNKKWYRREFKVGVEGGWKRVSPPTIIDGHLRQEGEYIKVATLNNNPLDLPQNID